MVYPRLVFFLFQQDTPFLLLFSYTTNKHSSCMSALAKPYGFTDEAQGRLRSGTSIGANLEEAQAGQSRADFISKNAIALKEARETHYWLRLFF